MIFRKTLQRVLVLSVLFIVLLGQAMAQSANMITTLQAGYWNDPSTWNTGKIPDSSSVVLLHHDLIVNRDVKCFALYTNGFNVKVLPAIKIGVSGPSALAVSDSLLYVSFVSTSTTETLQTGFTKNGLEYLFFGTKDANGKLDKFTRAQYRKLNTSDTVINIVYDDSNRVKAMYANINGINDSSYFKFTYTDSNLFTTRFKIDWQTETYLIREIMPSRLSTHSYAPYGLIQNEGFDINLGLVAGGFAAIGVGAIAVTFGSAVAAGALAYYGFSATLGVATTWAGIGGIAGASIFLNSANASTIDNYPKPVPPPINPAYNSLMQKNPKLNDPKWFGQELPLLVSYQKIITAPTRVMIRANVLSDGGSPILTRGVCWRNDTLAAPTIADSKILVTPGLNLFGVESNDLDADKTYSFRSFATNKNGITYGAAIRHKIGGDTVKMLTDRGSWSAVFWGDGPNGKTKLGVMQQVREAPNCPGIVTGEYRTDKIGFSFNANFTGLYSELELDRYFSVNNETCEILGGGETYETNTIANTWEYLNASRTIRSFATIDGEAAVFTFTISSISPNELTGNYSGNIGGEDYYFGFIVFR